MEFIQTLLANQLLVSILLSTLPLVFIVLMVLVVLYTEMKVAAHIQDRVAYMRTGWHGVFQPIADMLKLLQKEDIIPTKADKLLFRAAPFIAFTGTYVAYAVLPFSSIYIGSNINLGAFFLVAAGSLVVIGILMAGWASNNKWSLFGGIRSAAQMISYEIPTALAVIIVVMITGSLNLQDVTKFQDGGIGNWIVFGGPLPWTQKLMLMPFTFVTFLIMFVASIAEVNRTPFDLPEAESELVQGFNTEYSGMRFAMFYLSEYANLFTVSAVVVSLFLGGWSSPFGAFMSGPVWGVFWFVTKAYMFMLMQIWLRWTLPRLRVDQLMYVSWKVLTPWLFVCLLAVGLILVI
ncbi:MAG: NADH-quinone oxidoreductase subunit H [Ignavibacteriales bacterium]|nr:NADH-quinone oxidoreductase subunit H [Ignavibacteriales bacterium]